MLNADHFKKSNEIKSFFQIHLIRWLEHYSWRRYAKNIMKKLLLLSFLFIGNIMIAQDLYNSCSAAFLNDQMIVEEYSATAKAKISKETTGWISAGAVSLGDVSKGEKAFEITEKLAFGVAIKDASTGTIMLFSPKEYKKIEAEKVLAKCRKGDSIIIMTIDNKFALPHNEILVY